MSLKAGGVDLLVDIMAFVQAMSSPDTTKVGVNGAAVYTEAGVGDYRVTLFTMLNRGLETSYIEESVHTIFSGDDEQAKKDLFVMAFQARDVRGGKGERKLFYQFMKVLSNYDRAAVRKMLALVPEYGCWRDIWELLAAVPAVEEGVFEVVREAWHRDQTAYAAVAAGEKANLSLLAKWLPRENSGTYRGLAARLAKVFYPYEQSQRKRMMNYRKEVSALNRALKTVEINMCGGTWRDIEPEGVPGRCMKLHTKAFLNERGKGDLRYPSNEDRMECRAHFQEFIADLVKGVKKVHGANVVMPHELVAKALMCHASSGELAINQGQWESIREETLKLGGLGKCVPLCDFSGSMDGVPKLVSLALGILISEINHSAFRDHILTFDAEPHWHSFSGKATLKEKLDTVSYRVGQGLNTNFYKACQRIIEKMKELRVPVGEEPEDLIVLTDMGFDDASRNNDYRRHSAKNDDWDYILRRIREEFAAASKEVWGEGPGWKPPRIVVWNLRAEYKDFHAKADQEGVVQLSGWSPAMLKALQMGGVQVMTPFQGMRSILDDARYDPVRKAWDEVHAGRV
jgi:hypothetical protein